LLYVAGAAALEARRRPVRKRRKLILMVPTKIAGQPPRHPGLSLEKLRERMPSLRPREHGLRTELQAIADQINDRAMLLRLAETLTAFLTRLRSSADTFNIIERQRIVRVAVKEVLVWGGHDRHPALHPGHRADPTGLAIAGAWTGRWDPKQRKLPFAFGGVAPRLLAITVEAGTEHRAA
jgi:hypothetical protein